MNKRKSLYFLTALITLLSIASLADLFYDNTHLAQAKLPLGLAADANSEKPAEIYRDALISLLTPYYNKAISDYYSQYLSYLPKEDPWFVDILEIQRIKDKTFWLLVKIKVNPYVGPHNSVGEDHITFTISPSGDVKLEEYEHIKSSYIPPNWQFIIKKPLPN